MGSASSFGRRAIPQRSERKPFMDAGAPPAPSALATPAPQPAAAVPAALIESVTAQQNFSLALAAGLGAAVAGAVLWAVLTFATHRELRVAAVAVGFLVGSAIRETSKSDDRHFGYLGAACALLGCLLGNFLTAVVFTAQAGDIPITRVLAELDFARFWWLCKSFWSPLDIVLYAIAVYYGGYRFAYHRR